MKDFDEGEQLEKIQREKRTREPDEDGFVVVKQRYVLKLIVLVVLIEVHAGMLMPFYSLIAVLSECYSVDSTAPYSFLTV